MNHCKDCKHWQPLREIKEIGVCLNAPSYDGGGKEQPAYLPMVFCDWGAEAHLVTDPTFGCVMWEGKGKTS